MSAGADEPYRCSHCAALLLADLQKPCDCPTDIAYRWTPAGAVEDIKVRQPLTTEQINIAARHIAAAVDGFDPHEAELVNTDHRERAVQLLRALGL